MPRYIPPWQRQQGGSDIAEDYAPRSLESLAIAQKPASVNEKQVGRSDKHIHAFYVPDKSAGTCARSTLNDCSAYPGELAYILRHPGTSPQWPRLNLIYAKSNLHLVKHIRSWQDEASSSQGAQKVGNNDDVHGNGAKKERRASSDIQDAAPESPANEPPAEKMRQAASTAHQSPVGRTSSGLPNHPIAVFEHHHTFKRYFRLAGYFTVTDATFLPACSLGLDAMMCARWGGKVTGGGVQREFTRHEWAVLRLAPFEGPMARVPVPWDEEAADSSARGNGDLTGGLCTEDEGEEEDDEDGGVAFDYGQVDGFDSGSGSDAPADGTEDSSESEHENGEAAVGVA